MSMTNAERQAAYRARRKAELDALRNGTPVSKAKPSRNAAFRILVDDCKQLRNEVGRLQQENEALRNSKTTSKAKPSRNGKCRSCEKLQRHLDGAKMREQLSQDNLDGARMWISTLERKVESKEIPFEALAKATAKVRADRDKEKAKRLRAIKKLQAMRASRNDLLPDEVKQAQTELKTARTRLRNDRSSFDARVSVSKKLDKTEIRRVQRCLHPDMQPEEKRKQFDTALASFNRAVT